MKEICELLQKNFYAIVKVKGGYASCLYKLRSETNIIYTIVLRLDEVFTDCLKLEILQLNAQFLKAYRELKFRQLTWLINIHIDKCFE